VAQIRVLGNPNYNVLLSNGKPAGQEVWHSHYHIIPRAAGDGLGYKWKVCSGPTTK
jgi:diadenosine tetraphosphate (Ap4A) HIT family hydrolase